MRAAHPAYTIITLRSLGPNGYRNRVQGEPTVRATLEYSARQAYGNAYRDLGKRVIGLGGNFRTGRWNRGTEVDHRVLYLP